MSHTVHEVPGPADPPHPLTHALVDFERRLWFEIFGHEDFHDDLTSWLVTLTPTEYAVCRVWLALPGGVRPEACAPGDALGYVRLDLNLREDTNTAHVFVAVAAEHRGRGLGGALLERALAERGDRAVLQTWSVSPEVSPADVRAVAAASGSGAVDGTSPGASWLLHRGFVLEQAERYSVLDLTREGLRDDLAVLERTAAAHAGPDYELVAWQGPTPDHLRDHVAAMQQRFSTDAPSAGLDVEEQVWDASRVAHQDARVSAREHDRVQVAVRHLPTGDLVALTELVWPRRSPVGVQQWITLVHPAHRGHRLGLWIKTANLRHLLRVNPDAARVHTWNADENIPILAINEAIGFEGRGVEGAWQKRL